MTKRKLFASIVAVTVCLFGCVPLASAGTIQLTNVTDLTPGGSVVTYPTPVPDLFDFDLVAGGITVNFSTPGLFSVLDSDGLSFDFPAGTTLLLNNFQSGPLTIAFATGVREFGLFAQSLALDQEKFTFDVLGSAATTTFSAGPADNTGLPGVALFLGARATNGDLITKVIIGEDANNDFAVGPLTFSEGSASEPVPEPASLLLIGAGLLAAGARARKRLPRD